MKKLKTILAVLILFECWSCSQPETVRNMAVNPVLGDESFRQVFGKNPDAGTDEKLRIQTHLAYVENLLRRKAVAHLTPDQQVKRTFLLDKLRDYFSAGVFPGNYDFPNERKPCFIDKFGNICAVGYLIEQTAGREFAEQIDSRFRYAAIKEMNMPEISAWAATNGLTVEECAIIQPTYGPEPVYSYNFIPPKYGAASAILNGANLSLTVVNTMQLAKGEGNKLAPILGLAGGAGSVCLGLANLADEPQDPGYYGGTNETKKALSFLNIGLGSATMVLSTWNLLSNKPPKEKKLNWNVYSLPSQAGPPGVGASITRKF